MIFHCHHYNTFLQRTILEAPGFDAPPVLVGAAAEVAYAQLQKLFAADAIIDTAARKALAQDVWRWAGFGTFDLSALSAEGGVVTSTSSHYAHGWLARFGKSAAAVCFFDAGWLAGALSAIFGLPLGAFSVEQKACMAAGADANRFELARGPANYSIYQSVGAGRLTTHTPVSVSQSAVDYEGIYNAVSGMDLSGNEEGRIAAFGVYLTRHYANYYNRVSFELLRTLVAHYGDEGYEAAAGMLTEAGHVCAFHTFGGIMLSAEWAALIEPSLVSPEDWMHGITAVVNALGWGRWQVTDVASQGSRFVIHDDYESVGYEAMYGRASHPVAFLAAGGVAGACNLIYVGNIQAKPQLDEAFYQARFKSDGYTSTPDESRAMGDAVSGFSVTRA